MLLFSAALFCALSSSAAELNLPLNSWVKLSPLTNSPPSPRLGYEGACAWDAKRQQMIRYGGHNQGGGGEQHSETWLFDPLTARWTLKEPNAYPPGICCGQQNVFDPVQNRYLRFPSFSGSHGWQWWREIYLNDSSVWSYDPDANKWRNLRPVPTAQPRPLRCAAWDSEHGVVVMFGGETSSEGTLVYDPWENSWTRKKPATQPESRSGGNLAYDSLRQLHILFGAQFSNDPHTWAYSLRSNTWIDLKTPTLPPTDKNDAVLAFDPGSGHVLAVVRVSEGTGENAKSHLETWALDVGKNAWRKMNPTPEPPTSGSRARNLIFAPELNAFLLENRTHPPTGPAEQQVLAYRIAERTGVNRDATPRTRAPSRPQPRAVEDVVVSVVSATHVELTWAKSAHPDVLGYHVERALVEVATEDQLKRLKKQTAPLAGPSVGAITRIGAFTRLTRAPVTETNFTDASVDLSQPKTIPDAPLYERKFNAEQFDPAGRAYRFAVFAYRVRAVTRSGETGGPSAAEFTIPSMPRWLFARDAGTTCHLKWAANPERGLRGYRVYRMDGRYEKDAIPRLTAEPITETKFTDEAAGKPTRRFYVVAVDVLGQEGFPSAPVWFQRDWKSFYAPFSGEWHQ